MATEKELMNLNQNKMKLIKTADEQGVMYSLSGDNLPENYVLSKQNCDEEFAKAMGIVDVEKLAEKLSPNSSWKYGFIRGFNKAMELNKDKVFTLEDIEEAFAYGQLNQVHNQKYFSGSKTYIQSLQQPTEINVEIVMDICGDKVYAVPEPKLDSEGCLILKRK